MVDVVVARSIPSRPRRLPVLVLTQQSTILTFSPNALFFYRPLERWVARCKPSPTVSLYALWYPEYETWSAWNEHLDV